jgi:hypothetical protein
MLTSTACGCTQAHAATGAGAAAEHAALSQADYAAYRSASLERLLAQQKQWAPGELPSVDLASPLAEYLMRPLPSQRYALL